MLEIEEIKKLHADGFNCAQIVFGSAAEELGLDIHTARLVSALFGGGMSCKEVCGAVTGALMALGLKYGNSKAGEMDLKERSKAMAVEFMSQFKEKHGSYLCGELLSNYPVPEGDVETKQKCCTELIADGIRLLYEKL